MNKQKIELNKHYNYLNPSKNGWYRVTDFEGNNVLYYGQSRLVAELMMNVAMLDAK